MKVLITGGAGFIGSNLAKRLWREKHEIFIVDDVKDGRKLKNLKGLNYNFSFMDEFWQDPKKIITEQRIEFVFHLGAISSTSFMDGNVLLKNNVDYSIDLIEACVDVGIPIHFASSASIFGNLQANGGTVSAHTTDPLNPYAYSKALVDEHIKSLESRQTGDYPNPDIVSFRYFNVYGLGEDHKDGQSSPILKFYNEARETGEISVFDIESSRDFVNIYDVVAAHIEDLNNFETFRKHNTGTRNSIKFLDVGTACPLSFIQVAEIVADFIERQTKEKIRIKIVPFPKSLKNNYQFYTRASNSILYEPLTERESAMHIRKYLDRLLDRDEEMKKLLVPLQKNESYTRKKSLI